MLRVTEGFVQHMTMMPYPSGYGTCHNSVRSHYKPKEIDTREIS